MAARTVYYAAATLDGFIADPGETLTWLTGFKPAEGNAGEGLPLEDAYTSFFEGIGALVMGSRTYEFVRREGYWPYGDMPAWVYTSRELERMEQAGGLRFASGEVAADHAGQLEAAAGRDVWILGGGELASQYVEAGLLDELRVTVVPIVMGKGLPLFARPVARPMRLTSTRPFANGMVELSYEVSS